MPLHLHQAVLTEQQGGPNQGPESHRLILDAIIRNGGETDHYQILVLSLLSEFFKGGCKSIDWYLDPQYPISGGATTTRSIETIKSLSPSDKVNLAQYLQDCIAAGESNLHMTHMSSSDWIRYVLQKDGH